MTQYALIKTKEGLVPGLKTYYYTWSGEEPPEDLMSLKPVKEDVSPWINNVWWDAPAPDVPAEFFAIAWLGFIFVPKTGLYRFYVTSDDGSKVWIDGKLVIDAWKDQPPTTYVSEPILLEEGFHRLKYYFYNRYAFAEAVFGWIPPDGESGPVPKNNLYHNVGDRVFFTGLPDGYQVELLPVEAPRRKCVFDNDICGIRIDFDEMPLKTVVRILDDANQEVFATEKHVLLWGGDEIKITVIK